MTLYTKIKNFIINLTKLTSKQVAIVTLVLLAKLLEKTSYFAVFYMLFYYDKDKSFLANIPTLVMLGVTIAFWFAALDILKTAIYKNIDAKSHMAWIARALYSNRILILFAGVYYYYSINFTPGQVYIYTTIVLTCRIISKYVTSWELKLQKLDWRVKDGTKQ